MKRSFYENNISTFLNDTQDKILGVLARHNQFELATQQKNAWVKQIKNLKEQLSNVPSGKIFFEFVIPRMGKRVDVLLLIKDIIFVLEYKVGANFYDKHAKDQALDYALDLKNFHEGSHHKYIVPILICTSARTYNNEVNWYKDKVAATLLSNGHNVSELIEAIFKNIEQLQPRAFNKRITDNYQDAFLKEKIWANSGYKPTPTIVEAAQALYQGHSVDEISRSDAGAKNLTHTANCISDIIKDSKQYKRKSICFVTGVPGAGKTLAGLNISTRKMEQDDEHAVFLSGNGPLVAVLREALARDEVERIKAAGKKISKKEAIQKVSAFIQNIHHFRDEGVRSPKPPAEHIVVFDEAQRAWNQAQAQKFMESKKVYPTLICRNLNF
ncbi:DNA/RNA helicase domain-containing protein [Sphingorhabdus lutea]|uniref:DNA/RNA helicase domain-containing protein n=1 Tax=Sphingorhabdus lutea TaxID=1913578 RepID=UPI000B10B0AE|nr:DNA/RNA helicase domain-containing protein [Sphingorhabdus lutea]